MNIKINKQQAEYLFSREQSRHLIGSRLYGTNREDSDWDYLVIYNSEFKSDSYLPNYHQFQYTEGDKDYIFTSEERFRMNLFSGDSTINADVILSRTNLNDSDKLNLLRTYNIIKAFIGFARRDTKHNKHRPSNLIHIHRGLTVAESLLENKLPTLDFKNAKLEAIEYYTAWEQSLRTRCNKLYEQNEILNYPKQLFLEPHNDLELLLIQSNNIKEFKY